jgi:hypothetical protein
MALTDSDTLNYRGELFAIGAQQAPFLAAIAANAKRTSTFKFPIALPWSLSGSVSTIKSEEAAAIEGDPNTTEIAQDSNVCQIMKYDVEATLKKQSTRGQFSSVSLNVDGFGAGLTDLEFQKMVGLKQIALDADKCFLHGTFVDEGTSATAVATRGIFNAIATNTVPAGGAKLEKTMIEELIREMIASGALWGSPAIVCNSFQLQMLSDIYGYAPQDRTMGGVAIDRILVPGGPAAGIRVLFDPNVTTSVLGIIDLGLCYPVFCPVPASMDEVNETASYSQDGLDVAYYTKGTIAAKKGGFLYTQIGLDYGAEEMHGSITGLAVTA